MKRRYLPALKTWLHSPHRKPLVLRGARQVGKSTLVRMLAESCGLRLLEINLERHVSLDAAFKTLNMAKIERELSGVLRQPLRDSEDLLFFDEVQATPHALAALRYFFEERPGLPVIAAGSLLEFVLADHTFSMPVGRIEYMHIQPLSFEEFLEARGESWLIEQLEAYVPGVYWPSEQHRQLLEQLRLFLFVGGMPEAVARFIDEPRSQTWRATQDSIVDTYRDDFGKYARRAQLNILPQVYERLPRVIGRKVKYSEILPSARPAQVANAIGLLSQARILHCAFHTVGSDIPLSAATDHRVYKPYWLDVGLLNRMLGLDLDVAASDTKLFHEGALAEQFVAQHLVDFAGPRQAPSLHYWLRTGKKNNAEVDFLVQVNQEIVPIEVKSGRSGSLKSLQQFMAERGGQLAVKFSTESPLLADVSHTVITKDGGVPTDYKLLSLPLYFVGQLRRLINTVLSPQ